MSEFEDTSGAPTGPFGVRAGVHPDSPDGVDDGGSPRVTVMLAAFEGWNDAGDAASDALKHLHTLWDAEKLAGIDPDDYYDLQFTRPVIRRDESGTRRIQWPGTRFAKASVPDSNLDVVFVHGVEPSYKWHSFTASLIAKAQELDVDYVVLVGALLADVPHSRPIPVNVTSDDAGLAEQLDLQEPQYEGPVGIVGVLAEVASLASIPTLSVWAAVPHYVGHSPSPKAQLALLNRLEEMLTVPVDTQELAEEAEAWERGVNELATDDPEIEAYVRQLEEAKDTVELPEASGESIAREFERYLKKRGGKD